MAKGVEVHSSKWIRKQSQNVKELLKLKQRQLLNLLDYDVSLLLMFNRQSNVAVVESAVSKEKNFNLEENYRPIFINKVKHSPIKRLVETLDIVENYKEELRLIKDMESELYIPLFEPSDYQYPKLEGCLYLGSSDYKEFSLDSISDSKICNIISDISILFLSEFIDFKEQDHLLDLTCVFVDILGKKELHLPSHSFNVASWAKEIGITLGFNNSKLQQLILAGLLHDIGKTMVSYKILNKTSPLNKREYEKIKEHSNYGSPSSASGYNGGFIE